MEYSHITVLQKETVDLLNIQNNKLYVDCTLGFGGHSKAMFEKNDSITVIGIDQDIEALEIAKKELSKKNNFLPYQGNFQNLEQILKHFKIEKVDGFIFDLGVSSLQFDKPERGFSFQKTGPLDMRMDTNNPLTAKDIVNNCSDKELTNMFQTYGEEKFSWKIAQAIVKYRQHQKIETTTQLDQIIKDAIPKKFLYQSKNPSKKVFQALRIFVNQELLALETALKIAVKSLNKDGRIAVISFHSLEDRIVKQYFKSLVEIKTLSKLMIKESDKQTSDFKIITKNAIVPSEKELEQNRRSKSAKLRVLQKVR